MTIITCAPLFFSIQGATVAAPSATDFPSALTRRMSAVRPRHGELKSASARWGWPMRCPSNPKGSSGRRAVFRRALRVATLIARPMAVSRRLWMTNHTHYSIVGHLPLPAQNGCENSGDLPVFRSRTCREGSLRTRRSCRRLSMRCSPAAFRRARMESCRGGAPFRCLPESQQARQGLG